jgi:protein-S-isoprenylcysteine O-methyltransferase Ste14
MKQRAILPPTFFNSAAIVSIVLHFALPVWRFTQYPLNLLGIIPIVFGGVLNIWADQIFKKANTTVKPFEKPSALIVSGPFRGFRHPMYLGMLAILIGISIICGSVMSLVGPASFWIIIRIRFIPPEEQSMLETFGEEYKEYQKRVLSWM